MDMNTASGFAFLVLIFVAPMWIATTVNLGVISIEPTKTCSERSVKKIQCLVTIKLLPKRPWEI
jgi:hypothetical protein